MKDVFMQPIIGMLDKLGISKTASEEAEPDSKLSNAELVKELGKLAGGDMPEDLAGQEMHDKKTPLDKPENPPVSHDIENNQDSAYRLQKRIDDNLDSLNQSSAPLSDPKDLDTDQDPLARMAAKIACAIEPALQSANKTLNDPAKRVCDQMDKTAGISIAKIKEMLKSHPWRTAGVAGLTGLGLGGGLGFFGGKRYERKGDMAEDNAIFQLGAEIGGRLVAEEIANANKKLNGGQQ